MSVVTRTEKEETGTRITYDRTGAIVSQETTPRAVGTTIILKVHPPGVLT